MASFFSGQDESNLVLWLAIWVVKMDLSCLLGTNLQVVQEKFPWKSNNKYFIVQDVLVQMAWHNFFLLEHSHYLQYYDNYKYKNINTLLLAITLHSLQY